MNTHRIIPPRNAADAPGETTVSSDVAGRVTGHRWQKLGEELVDLGQACVIDPQAADRHRDHLAEVFAKEAAALGAIDFQRVIRPTTLDGRAVFAIYVTPDSDHDIDLAIETTIRHLQSHCDMRIINPVEMRKTFSSSREIITLGTGVSGP